MSHPDPDKLGDALQRLFADPQPVELSLLKWQAWCICSALQLACRHPQFVGPSRRIVEDAARQILEGLTANDPDLCQLAAMGWLKQFDE